MVSSRAASAASFLFAKGSITLREPFLEILGAAARIAMSDVPRRLLRAGVERSRRFWMLPLSLLDLAVVAFVGLVSRRVAVGVV